MEQNNEIVVEDVKMIADSNESAKSEPEITITGEHHSDVSSHIISRFLTKYIDGKLAAVSMLEIIDGAIPLFFTEEEVSRENLASLEGLSEEARLAVCDQYDRDSFASLSVDAKAVLEDANRAGLATLGLLSVGRVEFALEAKSIAWNHDRYAVALESPTVQLEEPPEEIYIDPEFLAIHSAISGWSINVPEAYTGHCEGSDTHAWSIYKGLLSCRPVRPRINVDAVFDTSDSSTDELRLELFDRVDSFIGSIKQAREIVQNGMQIRGSDVTAFNDHVSTLLNSIKGWDHDVTDFIISAEVVPVSEESPTQEVGV